MRFENFIYKKKKEISSSPLPSSFFGPLAFSPRWLSSAPFFSSACAQPRRPSTPRQSRAARKAPARQLPPLPWPSTEPLTAWPCLPVPSSSRSPTPVKAATAAHIPCHRGSVLPSARHLQKEALTRIHPPRYLPVPISRPPGHEEASTAAPRSADRPSAWTVVSEPPPSPFSPW